MPLYRSIQVSVVSQLELGILPEFPHPDNAQLTHRSPKAKQTCTTGEPEDSPLLDSKADAILGRPTVIKAYIPSMPSELTLELDLDIAKTTRYSLLVEIPSAPRRYQRLQVVVFQGLHQ